MSQCNWWARDQRKRFTTGGEVLPELTCRAVGYKIVDLSLHHAFQGTQLIVDSKNNVRTNENFVADLLLSIKLCKGSCLVRENTVK